MRISLRALAEVPALPRDLISTPDGLTVKAWYCPPDTGGPDPFGWFMRGLPACIPSEAEVKEWNRQQMATTQLTPENQQAAIDWSDNVLAADRKQNPGDYCQSDAVAQSPWLAQTFGPSAVCKFGGPDGSGLLMALGIGAVAIIGTVLYVAAKR